MWNKNRKWKREFTTFPGTCSTRWLASQALKISVLNFVYLSTKGVYVCCGGYSLMRTRLATSYFIFDIHCSSSKCSLLLMFSMSLLQPVLANQNNTATCLSYTRHIYTYTRCTIHQWSHHSTNSGSAKIKTLWGY